MTAIATPPAVTPADRTQPLPGATTALLLLLAINLFNFLDRQVLAAVERSIRTEVLIDETGQPLVGSGMLSGALMFAFLITYMISAPLFGLLADRLPRWRLVAVGVILWSLASGASGLDWGMLLGVSLWGAYCLLFATRCLVGIGEGAYGPVAPTMLADLYPVSRRGRIMAWFYMAMPIGGAMGYALGDWAKNVEGLGWRSAFFLVTPPGLVLGVLCLFMREPPRGEAEAQPTRPVRKISVRKYLDLLRIPSYSLNMVGMTCMSFAMGGLAWWMDDFLTLHEATPLFGIPPLTAFGILTALAGLLATMLGGLAGDWLRKYVSGSYFLVSGISMILGFPMVLLAIWSPFPLAWVFVFLAVFSLFFNTAPTNAINANVTHPAVRASAFGFNILVMHLLGDAISPLIIGGIRETAGGLDAGFLLVSLLMLVGGAFWIWGTFYLQRDTELAPTRVPSAS